MTVLVTGGAGFVGNNVIDLLVKQGKSVRAMVRNTEKAQKRLGEYGDSIEIVQGDVTDRDSIPPLMRGVSAVVHTVAISMEKGGQTYEEVNYQGTINMVDAASDAGVPRFINISQNARKLVFAGTFTAGGLEIAVENGRLRIVKEGKAPKFLERVEQVTFNGSYAAETGQPVLYVTERCVLRRGPDGLELIEIAPGIDLERDILAHMAFAPIVRSPRPMDMRIFRPEPMGLEDALLGLGLDQRISYDAERNTLFLNFEGLQVRSRDDIERIRDAVEQRCREIGRRVAVIVNYDSSWIDPTITDAYAEMVRYMEETHYTTVSRYTTSAFLRMKLGEALSRRAVAPHIFETCNEAQDFLAAGHTG